MRRAQLRLRGLVTMIAVAVFVAAAALTALPRQHTTGLVALVAAQQGPIHRLPDGIRWY
jgi:anti-sigma-K factor RskA